MADITTFPGPAVSVVNVLLACAGLSGLASSPFQFSPVQGTLMLAYLVGRLLLVHFGPVC